MLIEQIEQKINDAPEINDEIIHMNHSLFSTLIYGTAGSGKTTIGIKIQRILLKIAKKIKQCQVCNTCYCPNCDSVD